MLLILSFAMCLQVTFTKVSDNLVYNHHYLSVSQWTTVHNVTGGVTHKCC